MGEDFLVTFVKVFPAKHRDLSAGSVQFFRKTSEQQKRAFHGVRARLLRTALISIISCAHQNSQFL